MDEAVPEAYPESVGETQRWETPAKVSGVMTKTRDLRTRDLNAKADQFAAWAARAKARTLRNAYLSLEKTCRALAAAAAAKRAEHPANPG